MALTIDLAPTLLELAGLTPAPSIQGRSLVPVFAGAPGAWRQSFLIEYYSDTVFPRILKMGYTAVRTQDAKYIEYRDLSGMDELYDLAADPYEEQNLIRGNSAPAQLTSLKEELQRLAQAAPAPGEP